MVIYSSLPVICAPCPLISLIYAAAAAAAAAEWTSCAVAPGTCWLCVEAGLRRLTLTVFHITYVQMDVFTSTKYAQYVNILRQGRKQTSRIPGVTS